MMINSVSLGLFFNAVLLLSFLFLYFNDPDAFYSKMYSRIFRIKFFFRTHFGKTGKEYKEKYKSLSRTISRCEYLISRYVNKKNLSTLSDDETLQNLLKHYKELLYIDSLPEEEVSLEKINKEWEEIIDLYLPEMDPYYQGDF